MILKITRDNSDQNWWMLDNIAKISCSKRFKKGGKSVIGGNILIFDHPPECDCIGIQKGRGICSDCNNYYKLVCRTKDDDEFDVVFDTIAYICNDDGKTIERIVANYNRVGETKKPEPELIEKERIN